MRKQKMISSPVLSDYRNCCFYNNFQQLDWQFYYCHGNSSSIRILGTAGTFFILSIFLFAAFHFVLLTLPETKGESLEKIDQLFMKPYLERINLSYYLR